MSKGTFDTYLIKLIHINLAIYVKNLNSTAEEIFTANSDYMIAEQCRVREDNIIHEKVMNEKLEALANENASLTNENESLTNENASLTNENNLLAEEIIRFKKLLAERGIKE